MNKAKKIESTPGQKIGGLLCKSYLKVADMVIIWLEDGGCKVFKAESISKKAVLYTINGAIIEAVAVPNNHEILILKTKDKEYFRDFNNQEIEEAELWADYYFEPHTASFYRQDTRGNWYDIDGYRLGAPVFLKDNVLCSLPGKTSRKSVSYHDQKIVISPTARLIQVGKLVYDTNLELVHYFGEKITGLGNKNISFGGEDVLQEVYLGLNRRAFINEYTKAPYLLNNEEITGHNQTVVKGNHRFEVFKTDKGKYVVENDSNGVFRYKGAAVALDFSTFLVIGHHELILAKKNRESFFMNINSKEPFTLPGQKERIIFIDQKMVRVKGDELYNMKTKTSAFVFNDTRHEVFTLNEGTIQPESIVQPEGYENNYGFANIGGDAKLFYKKKNTIIQLGEENLEVNELLSKPDQKLLNAIGTNGEQLVLDARKGLDHLELGMSGTQKIVEVLDVPHPVGHTVLQNTLLQTLGGSEPRVIDLNEPNLNVFTLPKDLKEYPEQNTPSSFHGNPVLAIDFGKKLELLDSVFLTGTFLSFFGNTHSVILQHNNARPLHLDGAGHRNELVTGFNPLTIGKAYHLGPHQMIGAYTLTEDLKENELLFSINTQKSWLSFYDSFLPIMKRVVELKGTSDWEYLLFELREISKTIEYIAVEKVPPHRVLVEKKKGKPVPMIIESKEKVLKTPEEISAIRKVFLADPGYLMEVD